MAVSVTKLIIYFFVFLLIALSLPLKVGANDILGCGGFIESHVKLDFSKIEVGLYTKSGSLREKTECAPTNGYFFLPLYEKGDYVLKVHPPPGWSFEPSEVAISVDGVTDKCSLGKDVNFAFNGFGITGKVITAGQSEGPKGVLIQLVDEQGETRHTTTAAGGDFHFTPVIPGKYILKASHTKWPLSPSQATLQVTGGNTALPAGALVVKGYDVTGTVTSFGNPVPGVHVLLYSKEESPKLRVEGCKTGLLQGVPDAPICYAVSDSTGKFTFGLVPAGDYKLLALSKTPGQATVVFNLKPESVQFTVRHDSQHIENAFEITSYTVTGLVQKSLSGGPLQNARVFVSERAAAVTDAAGKYTLSGLAAGDYTVSFVHEQCEIDNIQISISGSGLVSIGSAVAARWRVCGVVRGAGGDTVTLTPGGGRPNVDADGNWCTFLAPGVYTASVELTEQQKQNGVQFYPITQTITVSSSPVEGVTFSELKATVRGRVVSASGTPLARIAVSLTHTTSSQLFKQKTGPGGEYEFKEVLPGLVSISIEAGKYCWAEEQLRVTVSGAEASVPDFRQVGHRITLHTDYGCEVEWATEKENGVFTLNPGSSSHCLPKPDKYTLTPKGCHQFNPSSVIVDVARSVDNIPPFKATSHASYIRVESSEAVEDLTLAITRGRGTTQVGPLTPRREGDRYVYEHTLFMAEGEVATVSAKSSHLVFIGRHPAQLVGSHTCSGGVTVVAARGITLAGRTDPPVAGVTVLLTSENEDIKQTIITDDTGTYSFGPVDASRRYTISARAESYALSTPDERGVIHARKLAQIIVTLIDYTTGKHLEEALVSVSGGSYRRTAVSGSGAESGAETAGVRFPALAPNDYYVKPHLRDYAFTPSSHLVRVEEGKTHEVTLRGVRVAWRISGRVQSLAGAGVTAHVTARGTASVSGTGTSHCANSDAHVTARGTASVSGTGTSHCANSDAHASATGHYTLRGLLPGCTYSIDIKPSAESNAPRYRLAHPPLIIEMKEKKDITDIRLIAIEPHTLTDSNVLVYTPNYDHYKTLRLKLYQEDTPHTPLLSTKLDATGYSAINNPGLMYVMPRLPVDNRTYVVQLESTLPKTTHSYEDELVYFTSDGKFKDITIEFLPKLRTSEQELRQTSILVVPLLGLVALAFLYRDRLLAECLIVADNISSKVSARQAKTSRSEVRPEILDKASIEQIVSNVNAAGKRAPKKRTQLIG